MFNFASNVYLSYIDRHQFQNVSSLGFTLNILPNPFSLLVSRIIKTRALAEISLAE